ncbi:hypothetical protein SH2C18_20520 [Clostridium sediminicola]|uniref:hypothetical protein n=1 Tax=Clostridium sediminicola TaxID=3114879 RepID=UPI0031F273AF
MLEMFLYAIGIMYTPGPMNLLGLNLGINKKLKETLATLPIATINFPANDIVGIKILIMSVILGLLATCPPLSYAVIGSFSSTFIKRKDVIKLFNTVMAIMLLYVALSIFKDHVYLVLKGINSY